MGNLANLATSGVVSLQSFLVKDGEISLIMCNI